MLDDLTDEERRLLVDILTLEITGSKFPLSPRTESLKRVMAKLLKESPAPPKEAPKQKSRSR